MKKALLLINGLAPRHLPTLEQYELILCTDGAYRTYQHLHPARPCDVVIGDFDSFTLTGIDTASNTQFIQLLDQNSTDFDKALHFLISNNISHVDVYGATGKESDHFFSNMSTTLAFRHQITLQFIDDYSLFFLSDFHIVLTQMKDKIISLIPFCEASHVTTQGLRYPLKNQTLRFGEFISVRNQAIEDEIRIDYDKGVLFVFIQQQIKE